MLRNRTAFARLTAIVAVALVGLAVSAQAAEGRTLAQAQGDAAYYAKEDCPHHGRLGKCLRSEGYITLNGGIGGGRWRAETRGWECNAFEPCGLLGDYRKARWYYTRSFVIENDGSRSHISSFDGDG